FGGECNLDALRLLARQDGACRKQALGARARPLVVVEEFEAAFPQLQDCHVGRRTRVERAAVIERREHARGIDGRARDDLAERHAEHDEFRHDVREVDDARGLRHHVPIRGDGIGPKALLRRALHRGPVEMIERSVAEIKNDAAAARGCHVREQSALVVEDAVGRRRVHVGDDVAALEQREDGAHRRIRLANVDHHREIEGGGRLLRAPQRFEIVGVGHVFRQPRLDADDHVAMARDRPLRQGELATFMSCSSPAGEMTPVRAMFTRARPTWGPVLATVAIWSMLSAPAEPASTQPVTPSCRSNAGPSLLRPAWVWISISPGATILPRASIVWEASPAMSASTTTILPPAIATSRIALSPAEGSMTRPPLIRRS